MAKGQNATVEPDEQSREDFGVSKPGAGNDLEIGGSDSRSDQNVIKLKQPPRVGTEAISAESKRLRKMLSEPDLEPSSAALSADQDDAELYFREPPRTQNPAEVSAALQRSFGEPDGTSLLKGDEPEDIASVTPRQTTAAKPEPQTELEADDQQEAAAELAMKQSVENRRQQMEAELQIDNGGSNFSGSLTGTAFQVIRRIPGVSSLLAQFETGALPQRIQTLNALIAMLRTAKTGAAITEGLAWWGDITGGLLLPTFGFILIIALPALPVVLVVYGLAQESVSPMARTIAEAVKIASAMRDELQAAYDRQQLKKIALARMQQLENEPMTNSEPA